MLHAFARRTSPARFRRAGNLRFKHAAASVGVGFKVNLRAHELTRTLRRQRSLARKLGRAAYLTAA